MNDYRDYYYDSPDGLRLYARDYFRDDTPLTLLCMHGLTRNSADFEPLCELLASRYRILAVDVRGRGRSDRDSNPANYHPGTYVQDMFRMIDALGLENLALVGTSMGGIMAMVMNVLRPGKFAGVILNDVGPVVSREALDRIRGYVGKTAPAADWAEAVADTRRNHQVAFPHYTDEDWDRFARRLYGENEQGIPELLYDPAIAQLLAASDGNAVPPDLWQGFDLLRNVPTLLIRGALSDVLSVETLREMEQRNPDLQVVEVPDVGHAPILDEPSAYKAIRRFLADLEQVMLSPASLHRATHRHR